MADWRIKALYLKNCNCIASCPCDTIGVPVPGPGCEGLVALRVTEGNFGDVPLTGAVWGLVVSFPGALHEGDGTVQPWFDEKTTPEQRDSLMQIASGAHGGPLFEILSQVVTTVHEPVVAPVEFEFDKETRRARLNVPGVCETISEPLTVPATGEEQRVQVRLPDGFEYKEMEVARCVTLKTGGTIKMDHHDTHSSLAEVDHSPAGLAALG